MKQRQEAKHPGSCGCPKCKGSNERIFRWARDREAPETVPASVEQVLQTPGSPLDAETRRVLEPRFQRDFSRVRIHAHSEAADSARDLNALAYTRGQDIVFGPGRYAPHTREGLRLLAHELVHVVQQSEHPGAQGSRISAPGEPAEREADQAAEAVLGGEMAPPLRATGSGLQRQTVPPPTPPRCDTPEGRARRRREGRIYGDTLCRAASNVELLNGGHPSDFDFVPADRRPFIRRTGERSWELAPPPVSISDPDELQCFVQGINEGIDAYQEEERFWGQIANALQLLSLALSTASVMRMASATSGPVRVTTTRTGGGGRPRLTLIQGGVSEPVRVSGGQVVSSRPPSSGAARASGPVGDRSMSAAPVLEPAPVAPPVVRPGPRPVPDPAPEPVTAARPRPVPVAPPMVLPGPTPRPAPRPDPEMDHEERNGCQASAVAQRGGNTCHDQFAAYVSGVTREWGVRTPEGLYTEFDALGRDHVLYEIKSGFGYLLNTSPRTQEIRERTIHRFIDQSVQQLAVARRCGYRLVWVFNNPQVAALVDGFIEPPVTSIPFPCDMDR